MKHKSKKKKINYKPFLIAGSIVVAVLIVTVVSIGIVKTVSKNKAKILDVAFYNLPENIVNPLKEKISAEYLEKINFIELTEEQYNVDLIAKNYDLFFSWSGTAVNQLADKAKDIPADAYGYILSSEIPENLKSLPLILDYWEMAYYIRGIQKTSIGYPRSLNDLIAVLEEMKEIVFVPMYCSGGNDRELLALISAFTESIGGYKAYENLVKLISKSDDFRDILDEELDSSITFRHILDFIKECKSNDLLYRKWIYSKDGELNNLAKERDIGVFFTSLTKHRNLPLAITEGYAADRFPLVNNISNHALIGNSVVCMKLSSTNNFDEVITSLVSADFQFELSKSTKLGPVSMTSQTYDRQADDVRYLAAVSEKGVVPDLYNAVFQTAPQKANDFAEQIRNYLK